MSTTNLYAKSEIASRGGIFSSSIFVWLVLVAYLSLVKIIILPLFPPIEIDAVAAIFGWDVIVTAGIIRAFVCIKPAVLSYIIPASQ